MKHLTWIPFVMLVAGILVSCTSSSSGTHMIRPTGKIGPMRINRYGHPAAPAIWQFCNDAMPAEPGIQTTECTVPEVSELFLGLGCIGKDKAQRDACWDARTWEMYFDGYPIDLPAFNIADFDGERGGGIYKFRVWRIRVRNLTEGEHTLHYVMHVNQKVDDETSLQLGTYELVVNFTVKK